MNTASKVVNYISKVQFGQKGFFKVHFESVFFLNTSQKDVFQVHKNKLQNVK